MCRGEYERRRDEVRGVGKVGTAIVMEKALSGKK